MPKFYITVTIRRNHVLSVEATLVTETKYQPFQITKMDSSNNMIVDAVLDCESIQRAVSIGKQHGQLLLTPPDFVQRRLFSVTVTQHPTDPVNVITIGGYATKYHEAIVKAVKHVLSYDDVTHIDKEKGTIIFSMKEVYKIEEICTRLELEIAHVW